MGTYNLLKLAIDVFNAVGDAKEFRKAQMAFDNAYKRTGYAEQGEYHHMWCKWIREQENGSS